MRVAFLSAAIRTCAFVIATIAAAIALCAVTMAIAPSRAVDRNAILQARCIVWFWARWSRRRRRWATALAVANQVDIQNHFCTQTFGNVYQTSPHVVPIRVRQRRGVCQSQDGRPPICSVNHRIAAGATCCCA